MANRSGITPLQFIASVAEAWWQCNVGMPRHETVQHCNGIEDHPRTPIQHFDRRMETFRYLTGERPTRRRPRGSHWTKLRRRFHIDPTHTAKLIYEFYGLAHTGLTFMTGDEEEVENRKRATEAMPTGRKVKRLQEVAQGAIEQAVENAPAGSRLDVLTERLASYEFYAAWNDPVSGEPVKLTAILEAGDLVRDG